MRIHTRARTYNKDTHTYTHKETERESWREDVLLTHQCIHTIHSYIHTYIHMHTHASWTVVIIIHIRHILFVLRFGVLTTACTHAVCSIGMRTGCKSFDHINHGWNVSKLANRLIISKIMKRDQEYILRYSALSRTLTHRSRTPVSLVTLQQGRHCFRFSSNLGLWLWLWLWVWYRLCLRLWFSHKYKRWILKK